MVLTPSDSGKGQRIARCPICRIAVWSHYAGAGERFRFVRVGTLDDPDRFPPEIHIFTASKQPWVILPPGVPAVPEYYDRSEHWPAESLAAARGVLLAPGTAASRLTATKGETRMNRDVRHQGIGGPRPSRSTALTWRSTGSTAADGPCSCCTAARSRETCGARTCRP